MLSVWPKPDALAWHDQPAEERERKSAETARRKTGL